MTNAAYFPQLSQTDVCAELGTTYEDIRQTLRLPWFAFGCRVGAKPLPNRKRRLNEIGFGESEIEKVRRVLNAFKYGNPKYLLLITAWSECLQLRPVGGGEVSAEFRASIPKGRADFRRTT